jgi:hypothetical protein
MLISEEYRRLNEELHRTDPTWGGGLSSWAVAWIAKLKPATILDYGAGKQSLARLKGYDIRSYDPAIQKIAGPPEPADLVACFQVLEHVEPEFLDNVLDHIQRLALKHVAFTVCTELASKVLADGRNAHLIVEPVHWWLGKMLPRWDVLFADRTDRGLRFIGGKCG